MMSDISAAVDAIRKQARLYEPLVKVAEELEKIGSLDNAKKEHEAAITILTGEKAKLSKEVKLLKDKLADGLADNADAINQAKLQGDAELKNAQESAARLVADAKGRAQAIAGKALQDLQAKESTALSKLNALSLSIEAAKAELIDIANQVEAKTAEFNSIQTKIEAAKAKVAALLG